MSKNWYPIITGNCTKCLACIVACPLGLLENNNGQINLIDGSKCPEGCKKCQIMCSEGAIKFYDGTQKSILEAFTGSCTCHTH